MFTRPDHLLPDKKKMDFFNTDVVFGSKESDVVHMMPIMGLLFLITACAFLKKMLSLFLSACQNVMKLIMWYIHKKWHTIRSKFWIYGSLINYIVHVQMYLKQ